MYNMPIGALITGIGIRAGRPIIDKTGLTGRYDDNITWLPDGVKLEDLNLQDVPAEFRPQDVSIFEALEKQAGLKLEPERAQLPVLVIDSVSFTRSKLVAPRQATSVVGWPILAAAGFHPAYRFARPQKPPGEAAAGKIACPTIAYIMCEAFLSPVAFPMESVPCFL